MTDPKLLVEQRRLLQAAQREARLRGEVRDAKPIDHTPPKRFDPRREYVRTFEQWARGANRGLKPYSWITTSPYNK